MIYNSNQIFGKVWKVTPAENGKYIDLQMTTSEKDGNEWKNSSWFPRAIGHAANSLKNVKAGDRIVITKSKFTNERRENADGEKRSYFRFIILEATIQSDSGNPQPESTPAAPQPAQAAEPADDCPW